MLFIISILFTICTLIVFVIYRNHAYLNNIPMPPASIFLGHVLDFKDSTRVLKIVTNYTIKFGGMLRMYIPPQRPSLVITDYKIIQYILNSDKVLEKSDAYNFMHVWLGTGLITAGVAKWKSRRKMVTPCLGRLTFLKNFVQIVHSLEDTLIEKLNNAVDCDCENIDLFPFMKLFTLDAVCETSMGVSINAQEKADGQYVKSVEEVCRIILNRMTTPYKRFNFLFRYTEDYRKQSEALRVINTFFDEIMENKRKTMLKIVEMAENEKFHLAVLDLLISCNAENKLTINDLREEINTILFGGHDTSAVGMAFTLYALAYNQDIQEKVIEEQKSILNCLENDPSYNDLQEMKYLKLVINEALRLYPPVPAIGRKLTSDIHLDDGIVLPKDLSICLFIYGCHHNPKYFPDPEKFIPERFENPDNQSAAFLPFSAGARNCVGRKMAMLEMKSCISKVVRNFKIYPPKPEYQLQLVPDITLQSRNGIRVSLQKRIMD